MTTLDTAATTYTKPMLSIEGALTSLQAVMAKAVVGQ